MHPGQRIIYKDNHRTKVVDAGRRWRKTSFGMRYGLRAAAVAGWPVLWGAPTFRQCRIGWDELYKAAGGIAQFHKGNLEVILPPANGIISYVSLDDPDNCRGKSPKLIIVDEAPRISEAAWQEVLVPMISDNDGEALLLGTPNGRNWFWRLFNSTADRKDAIAWQVPTLGVKIIRDELVRKPHPMENTDFPFSEAQRLFSILPQDIFRQEFLAAFLENEGAVFRNIVACMNAPLEPNGQHKDHNLVAGVDWAQKQDFTAISVVCADCYQEVARDRFNQIVYSIQRDRLKALYERWKPSMILAEDNSIGAPNVQALQEEGLPVVAFTTTSKTKGQIIRNLQLAFERAEIQWQADPVWTAELEAYEQKISPTTGRATFSAPQGVHDDTVIARALAAHAIGHRVSVDDFGIW